MNTELDTAKDAWSIASGNYASRFAAAVAGTAHLAAMNLRAKLAQIAASQLNVPPEEIEFAGGKVFAGGNPDNAQSFPRIAAASHWAPGTLPEGMGHAIRETVFWTPPELTPPTPDDEVNSSLCHGFIFDICGIEIDRITLEPRIDRYVTMHDCGRILHPGMVNGQVTLTLNVNFEDEITTNLQISLSQSVLTADSFDLNWGTTILQTKHSAPSIIQGCVQDDTKKPVPGNDPC